MAIKLEMLRCFSTVAHHGSLTDAAQALGRTPSAVSMMLKQFEDHIGAPLFETARKSRLTPLGELIYDHARREVAHFEKAVVAIEGLSRAELGHLRLAVTPSVAASILPPMIYKFATTHPQVQIDLRDMDSATIARAMQREQADIGIGTLPEADGLLRTELFRDAFGVVCRKDHQLAQDWDQLTWLDMQDHRFIANGLCHLISDPDFAPILTASRMMVPNSASLLALVRAGVGITVLPRLAVLDLPADLAFLPLADASAVRVVHMVTRPEMQLMPAVRAFRAMVVQMITMNDRILDFRNTE